MPELLLAAILWDAAFGYPEWLYQRIGHPVSWTGRLIARSEERFNKHHLKPLSQRLRGGFLILALVGLAGLWGWGLQTLFRTMPFGWIGEILVIASLLAARSLYVHVRAVAMAMRKGGLTEGRKAVAQIVGRDVEQLDESGVRRAAIESLAESFSDGVLGPVLAYLVFGLPGMAVYKAVNTADSMIGHLDSRYKYFGWAAARTDDVLNLLPSRISALFLSAAAMGRFPRALVSAFRYAGRHRSPNAGWPEAAMAGALDIRLGGPRKYTEGDVDGAWLGDGRDRTNAHDIDRGLQVYLRAMFLVLLGIVGLTFS